MANILTFFFFFAEVCWNFGITDYLFNTEESSNF